VYAPVRRCKPIPWPMLHFRIIGLIWFVLSLVGATMFAPQLLSMAADRRYGISSGFHDMAFWASQFFVEGFLLLGMAAGFGLFQLKHWAAICTRITGVLLLLYCLSFLLMGEYEHYDIIWLAASLFGGAFASYSLFVVWRFRPYDRAA
jgi:hypothetical protein